ncbi:unnamed protein product [Laminaria digitata]
MVHFKTVRRQVSKTRFEAMFNQLRELYPRAKPYLEVLYADRQHWAEHAFPLSFSMGSWTTSRIGGERLAGRVS